MGQAAKIFCLLAPPNIMPGETSQAEAAQQMEQFPLFDVDAVEALMRSVDPGGYIIYRTSEKLVVESNKFSPLCVSFKDESHEIMHNIVWYNASAFGGWAPFVGWVTIHPHPWKVGDPRTLLESNQLWPNLEELLTVLPELRQRLDPYTGDAWAPEAGAQGVIAVASQGKAREAMAGKAPTSASRVDPNTAAAPSLPKAWQGSKEDSLVFQLLTTEQYILSTAIAATASRYGGELPGLFRILISHNHMRLWAEEVMAKEMQSATPLSLLQVESSTMLQWLVSTEVAGCPFLTKALGPLVTHICSNRETLEVHPDRCPPQDLGAAASRLTAAVNAFVESLLVSIDAFPHCCAQLLYTLEQSVSQSFGVMASATVSRYLFHRYILDAFLEPAAVGVTDVEPSPEAIRSLSLVHQVLEKATMPEGEFSPNDDAEAHLVEFNSMLPTCRSKLSSFTQTILSMGAPYTPVMEASAANGGVVFHQADLDVLLAFLREHFVEAYSAICDMKGDKAAAEISSRLRPVLFGGIMNGPKLPIGEAPPKPHPIGLTSSVYETMVPPAMGTAPPGAIARSQLHENALAPPPEASSEALGFGANSQATGMNDTTNKTGIGIIFRKDPYGLFHVLTILKGGPAELSGVIEVGDVIMEINGNQVVGWSLAQLKGLIMGPLGTPVKLVFERPKGATTLRYEVVLFRGNVKPQKGQMAPATYSKRDGEDMRVFHEMSRLWSEVEELQQRRERAEKAFHAAEALRQEYEVAAHESESRAARLRADIAQLKAKLEKVRGKKVEAEGKVGSLQAQKQEEANKSMFGGFGGGEKKEEQAMIANGSTTVNSNQAADASGGKDGQQSWWPW